MMPTIENTAVICPPKLVCFLLYPLTGALILPSIFTDEVVFPVEHATTVGECTFFVLIPIQSKSLAHFENAEK